MRTRTSAHVAAALSTTLLLLTAGCGDGDGGGNMSDQSLPEVSARTRSLTTDFIKGLGEVTAPFRDSESVCSDDPDATSPVSFVHRGGLRTQGPAQAVLDDVVRRWEDRGWTSSQNGSFTNLDRDGYRLAIRIGDSGQSLAVTGTSPCVETEEPDVPG